jgi:hypothetical protein
MLTASSGILNINQLPGNILFGQFDMLDSAAGNAAILLMPENGGWRT